jgi:hypothetical protein
MMLPTFLVIGAMKSGTTSLCAYLAEHPQVFVSTEKELHFFIEQGNWHRERSWYESQFSDAAFATARGEGSTTYALWPTYGGVPERAAAIVPDARLVYVVREPLSRIVSHYAHQWAIGEERRPLSEALTEDSVYIAGSRYTTQLRRWLDHFPREQLLVVTSDALRSDRVTTMSRIQEFLGVDASFVSPHLDEESHLTANKTQAVKPLFRRLWANPTYRVVARTAGPRAKRLAHRVTRTAFDPVTLDVPDPTASHIRTLLRPEVAGLRDFVGGDFTGWGLL